MPRVFRVGRKAHPNAPLTAQIAVDAGDHAVELGHRRGHALVQVGLNFVVGDQVGRVGRDAGEEGPTHAALDELQRGIEPDVGALDLAALVPHPREHFLTYHGVLAPGSPLRSLVVPGTPSPAPPDASQASSTSTRSTGSSKFSWAELLLRVFGEDVLRCPACGGRRHMISSITDPATIRRILGHFRLRTEPYAFDPARPPPQAVLDW